VSHKVEHQLGEVYDLELVAQIDRHGDVRGSRHQADKPIDQVVDIAEGAGLKTVRRRP
jgi:hypothetical protein